VARLVVRHVEEDELLEIAARVEDLNAAVSAIRCIDVPRAIDSNIVGIAKLAGILVCVFSALTSRTPSLDPVSVFIELGNLRIEIAVADVDVVVFIT
jgi:hypothetical protein